MAGCSHNNVLLYILSWILFIELFTTAENAEKIVFTFPEFPYKDTTKNELMFREFESACEQSAACRNQIGIAKLRCIRECISPSCYRELYMIDQLEEGEIDVRLNSFKGCFVQRSNRPRN